MQKQGFKKFTKTLALLLTAGLLAGSYENAALAEEVEATLVETEGAENTDAESSNDSVASSDDYGSRSSVGSEAMVPIYGDSIPDGVYDIEVETDSSMFKVVSCTLTVADGEMTALMTLGGTGYSKLYMGTGVMAAGALEGISEYIENEDGSYSYEVSVEALDCVLSCASYSSRKEMWYDHEICFLSESLPSGTVDSSASAAWTDLGEYDLTQDKIEDGYYSVEVSLTGGSGKASITSPALLTVTDGVGTLQVIWSSENYDYMVVNGEKILPETTEGGSTFLIPVVYSDGYHVIGDTTAMSSPYEIDYVLTVDIYNMESLTEDEANDMLVTAKGNSTSEVVEVIIRVFIVFALLFLVTLVFGWVSKWKAKKNGSESSNKQ